MSQSKTTYKELQVLAKDIQQWLISCSPKNLEANPDLATQKVKMTEALDIIVKTLQKQKKLLVVTEKGPFHLKWEDKIDSEISASPFELTCWGAFPFKDFKEEEVKATVTFSFEQKTVEGTIEIIRRWDSKKDYKCIRYKCSANSPSVFLSGKVQVKVKVSYNGKQDPISTSFVVAGISEKGQAVLDFLKTITIDDQLREEAWEYAQNKNSLIEGAQTMDQLNPLQHKLQELVTAATKLHQTYNSFADTDLLKKFMHSLLFEAVAKEHLRGHWQVELAEGSALKNNLEYLNSWTLGSIFESNYLNPLKAHLALITGKIDVIKAVRQKAEADYKNAIEDLTTKNSISAELLTHIYSIIQIDKKFETLKMNHTDIIAPDGTDAFRLVQKPKETVVEIQKELKEISEGYKKTCENLANTYFKLYKGTKGKLIDDVLAEEAKGLAKKAKKEKKKLLLLNLYVYGQNKPLLLHSFIFESINTFLTQVNAFYKTFKNDFKRIHRDFSVIEVSGAGLSIKAYDPLSSDITDNQSVQNPKDYETTFSHNNPSSDKLVDDKGINPEDVNQGQLGDCYFLSSVASLAQLDPKKIHGGEDSIIQGPNKDGTYTVKLYIPDENNNPTRVSIAVDPSFLTKKVKKKSDNMGLTDKSTVLAQPSKNKEMWPQLLEKALAQLEGSYKEVEGGKKNMNLRGIQFLTGEKVAYHELSKGLESPIHELVQIYTSTKKSPNAQFGTKKKLEKVMTEQEKEEEKKKKKPASGESYILYKEKTRLYENHAYTLKSISNTEKGKEVFILSNPHNDSNIKGGVEVTITRKDLGDYFDSIIITP
jgi:hypothetical protein